MNTADTFGFSTANRVAAKILAGLAAVARQVANGVSRSFCFAQSTPTHS